MAEPAPPVEEVEAEAEAAPPVEEVEAEPEPGLLDLINQAQIQGCDDDEIAAAIETDSPNQELIALLRRRAEAGAPTAEEVDTSDGGLQITETDIKNLRDVSEVLMMDAERVLVELEENLVLDGRGEDEPEPEPEPQFEPPPTPAGGQGGGSGAQEGGAEELKTLLALATATVGVTTALSVSGEAFAKVAACKVSYDFVEKYTQKFFNSRFAHYVAPLSKNIVLKIALIMIIFYKLYLLYDLSWNLMKYFCQFHGSIQYFEDDMAHNLQKLFTKATHESMGNLVHIHYGSGELFDSDISPKVDYMETMMGVVSAGLDLSGSQMDDGSSQKAIVSFTEDETTEIIPFPWDTFEEFIKKKDNNGDAGGEVLYKLISSGVQGEIDPELQEGLTTVMISMVTGSMQKVGKIIKTEFIPELAGPTNMMREATRNLFFVALHDYFLEHAGDVLVEEKLDAANKLVVRDIPRETTRIIDYMTSMSAVHLEKRVDRWKTLIKIISKMSIGIFTLIPALIFWFNKLYENICSQREAEINREIQALEGSDERALQDKLEELEEQSSLKEHIAAEAMLLLQDYNEILTERGGTPRSKRKKKKKKKSKKPKKKKQSKKKPKKKQSKKKPKKKPSRRKGRTRRR